MNRCSFCFLPMLIGVGVLLGGCGTTAGPSSMPSYDPNKPRTFLAGADVQHAKSVAMGSAVSKGWKVVDSSDNRLLATRPLNAAAAQSLAGGPVSTASVEVGTDFYQRQEGVEVVVGAALIADRGTKTEKRIDFTDGYKNELNSSLDSLRRSWEENRWRIASATPPLPTEVSTPKDEGREGTPTLVEGERITGPVEQAAPQDSAERAWSEVPVPDVAPVAESSAGGNAAPAEDRHAVATPPPPASGGTVGASPANNMLVLNRSAEPGVWAYYAEHYAKIRGCAVSDSGAVLEEKRPEHEIHRVHCDNGQSFLVSCNAGTCRGIQ